LALFELILVNSTVSKELRALKDGHLSGSDGMEMRNFVLGWHTRLEVIINHTVHFIFLAAFYTFHLS
jgi:hypothetical protein